MSEAHDVGGENTRESATVINTADLINKRAMMMRKQRDVQSGSVSQRNQANKSARKSLRDLPSTDPSSLSSSEDDADGIASATAGRGAAKDPFKPSTSKAMFDMRREKEAAQKSVATPKYWVTTIPGLAVIVGLAVALTTTLIRPSFILRKKKDSTEKDRVCIIKVIVTALLAAGSFVAIIMLVESLDRSNREALIMNTGAAIV